MKRDIPLKINDEFTAKKMLQYKEKLILDK